jgi:peroxiredoxin
MNDVEIVESKPAPDFELIDSQGQKVKLSEFKGNKIVVLVFNRGFA